MLRAWGAVHSKGPWKRARARDGFSLDIVRFAPSVAQPLWIDATCGLSDPGDAAPFEVIMFARTQDDLHLETLHVITHFHRTGARLGLDHTVNLGRGWVAGSQCDHALISLPYIGGAKVERVPLGDDKEGRGYWLIPITKGERDFKTAHGLQALERRLEEQRFDYADPRRGSVV